MDAYVNIQTTSTSYNRDETTSYVLTGAAPDVADKVREAVLEALQYGRTKTIVLNPVHPINVVKV